jgi:hypothetical protein
VTPLTSSTTGAVRLVAGTDGETVVSATLATAVGAVDASRLGPEVVRVAAVARGSDLTAFFTGGVDFAGRYAGGSKSWSGVNR